MNISTVMVVQTVFFPLWLYKVDVVRDPGLEAAMEACKIEVSIESRLAGTL